jgi:hypothetical protein
MVTANDTLNALKSTETDSREKRKKRKKRKFDEKYESKKMRMKDRQGNACVGGKTLASVTFSKILFSSFI